MYTPQLSADNVRRLYHLKETTRRSMVSLLNEIVEEYFRNHEVETDQPTVDRKEAS